MPRAIAGSNGVAGDEGDINLPESGDWTVACVADDGVRLTIDGRSVLSAEAWSAHPPTEYRADLKLAAGWRTIGIDFFQAAGESKLQLLAAKKGQALQPVPAAWLRPPSARPKAAGAREEDLELQTLVKDSLRDRVKGGLALPTSAPPLVVRFTNAVPNETLMRRVNEEIPIGQKLATNLAAFATWKTEETEKAVNQADGLTAFSKEAQRILREELEKYRWRYEGFDRAQGVAERDPGIAANQPGFESVALEPFDPADGAGTSQG